MGNMDAVNKARGKIRNAKVKKLTAEAKRSKPSKSGKLYTRKEINKRGR